MAYERSGKDLFIVDNSVSGWTGLRYLEEWCGIAKAFDIATGFFEIGALIALDGKWQRLDKIRILMGSEMTHRTRKLLLESVKADVTKILDSSLERQKTPQLVCAGLSSLQIAFSGARSLPLAIDVVAALTDAATGSQSHRELVRNQGVGGVFFGVHRAAKSEC